MHRVFRAGMVVSAFMALGDLGCDAGESAGDGVNAPASTGDAGGPPGDQAPDATKTTCTDVAPRPGTVVTSTGAVTGAKNGTTWSWKGIPYAAPPVGALRWTPPAPMECWKDERSATSFGPQCAQIDGDAFVGSEDCLTLNVWAPESAKDAPVLVFIHGGGNTTGSASQGFYDGMELAARTGSIVVTIQYRLGALGFLTHAKLDDERPEHVSGNYGILDQIAALKWIQTNIAAFGGAPSKVLLFGESGGGQDTLVHVASPLSKGLFSTALVESGGVYDDTLAESETASLAVVDAVGCSADADVLACLRAQSAEKLVRVPSAEGPLAKGALRYGPVIDGYVLKANARDVIAKGEHNHVPLVLGTNADETSRMVANPSTEAEYAAAVQAQYGPYANALLAEYTVAKYGSPRKALVKLTTDATWTCPMRRLARLAAASQTEPVYRYFFTWTAPGAAGQAIGATHGLELPFVFRTFGAFTSSFTPSAEDLALSEAMQGYWSRFAASGDPNSGGAVAWPRYAAATDPYLELGRTIAAGEGLSTSGCDLIESLTQK